MALMEKSTPLGPLTCPRIMLGEADSSDEDHTVTLDTGTTYECTCGEVFLWEDQTHWERVES